jgi:shikimate kinase
MRGVNIVLLGFMGCGKTTIAELLAKSTNREWIDTDTLIEQREQCIIDQIFAEKGEAYFRRLETDILKECLSNQHKDGNNYHIDGDSNSMRDIMAHNVKSTIYSLGGGTPMTLGNGTYIRQLGTVFYLRLNGQTLYERLKGDRTRPLLQTADPAAKIRELLAVRDPVYKEAADYVIQAAVSPQKVAEAILERLC